MTGILIFQTAPSIAKKEGWIWNVLNWRAHLYFRREICSVGFILNLATFTKRQDIMPKAYTEDTLLSAMERAGAEDMPEEAERKGLGTPEGLPLYADGFLPLVAELIFLLTAGQNFIFIHKNLLLSQLRSEPAVSPATETRIA